MYINQFTTILLYILSALSLFSILAHLWQRRWLYYYGSKIKGPVSFPLIGSVHYFLRSKNGPLETFMGLCEKFGPVGKVWLGPQLFIFITRPKDAELVLATCLNKPEYITKWAVPMFGKGLVTATDEKWKKNRKTLNSLFSVKIVNSFVEIFGKHSKKLEDELLHCNSESKIDILPFISRCMFDIICESCMGIEPREVKEHDQCFSWICRAENLIVSRYFNPLYHRDIFWKLSSAYKELEVVSKKLWNFTGELVIKRRKLMEQNSDGCRRDFLSHLIKLTDHEEKWSHQQLMEETQTMSIAANNSTSIAASFFMIMMAMHSQIQQRIYEEILIVFGKDIERDVNLDDVNSMVYMDCAVKETLRLFPPGAAVMRLVEQNVKLDSCIIPQGSTVVIPIGYIQRDEKYWSDPLKYNPDRFLPQAEKHDRYSYLPFSIPPRNCIGLSFAMLAMKVILVTILRRFEVISCEYKSVDDIALHIDAVLMAANGYKVGLKKR